MAPAQHPLQWPNGGGGAPAARAERARVVGQAHR
jgi:hypothetical protein